MKALPTGLSTDPKSLSHRGISYAKVALNVPLAKLFEYALTETAQPLAGDRVVVPFGSRQQIGVVVEISASSELPAGRMKSIAAVRADAPRLPPDWLELMRFLAGYYQRPLGETIIGALPPRLRSVKPLPRKALSSPQTAGARFVADHKLTTDQEKAVERVTAALGKFESFLLHGVTGSGKTEVYLHLIARVLERGAQALVLVPEISLTPQLESRFRHTFPDANVAVMHSGLEDIARTRAWLDAARGDAGIVLGTRLGVLAPMPKLALVVVDEEHDASFKQQEGLRYSARDAAVYRARLGACAAIPAAPKPRFRAPARPAATSTSSRSAEALSASRRRSRRASPAPASCASTATARGAAASSCAPSRASAAAKATSWWEPSCSRKDTTFPTSRWSAC